MPVSIVVGGQYGSEGKGKVAHFFAKEYNASAVVRVGGPNSGHTVISDDGTPLIFKHLPTACLIRGVKCVLTSGNYISLEILKHEIELSGVHTEDLFIDPNAIILTHEHINSEQTGKLLNRIGSTGSGLGSAVIERVSRNNNVTFARDIPFLQKFLIDTNEFLRKILDDDKRVIIEGTQGFGLSLLHSGVYPYCTSRDTTASGFLSEAGLSPLDVDDVILVIRAFPIRVAGNSGPLKYETTWEKVSEDSGAENPLKEFTSVTSKIRRVAYFDKDIVCKAIRYNKPTKIVLNHVDYLDSEGIGENFTQKIRQFLELVESGIERKIDYVGINRENLILNGSVPVLD